MENIDHGGADLATSIISLVENGGFDLPNGHSVIMHDECRILATISVDDDAADFSTQQQVPLKLREYPYVVRIPNLSYDDFISIIANTIPTLDSIREKFIQTFMVVSDAIRQQKTSVDRALNSKDLFRAAKRLHFLNDLNDRRAIFVELLDIWAMHLTKQTHQWKNCHKLCINDVALRYHMLS